VQKGAGSSYSFEATGPQSLKGFADPVAAYRLEPGH
jgi:class 3 adenylate cyclase